MTSVEVTFMVIASLALVNSWGACLAMVYYTRRINRIEEYNFSKPRPKIFLDDQVAPTGSAK